MWFTCMWSVKRISMYQWLRSASITAAAGRNRLQPQVRSLIITIIIFRSANRESRKTKRNEAKHSTKHITLLVHNNVTFYTKSTENSSVNTESVSMSIKQWEQHRHILNCTKAYPPFVCFFTRTFQFKQLIKNFPKINGSRDILISEIYQYFYYQLLNCFLFLKKGKRFRPTAF